MRRFNTWGLLALTGAAAAANAAEQISVEEVIVTATRRAQEVQDVPASVAVVDPAQFAAGGLTSLSGVLKYVPGVNFNDGGAPGQGSITMRGVANIFSTPSVGIYLDDIPYGSVTAFAEGANFALDFLSRSGPINFAIFFGELSDQPRGHVEAVHHFGVACIHRGCHAIAHFWNTLPPVRSGERISATGACVATACLIERSTVNSSSSSRVRV